MFKCGFCKKDIGPNVAVTRVVTATKEIEHSFRSKANQVRRKGDDITKSSWRDDIGGRGFQIVSEVNSCQACAATAGPPVVTAKLAEIQA